MPEFVENPDRWMVSYADFVTLLFAFFVVLYATSKANQGIVGTQLSESILAALNLTVLSEAPVSRPKALYGPVGERGVQVPLRRPGPDDGPDATERVEQELAGRMGAVAMAQGISTRREADSVEISLPSRSIFPSGSRVLMNGALPILRGIADGLRGIPNQVSVEAHTDSLFIDNGRFSSNWDLTAARAAVVAQILQDEGIDASRLSVTGFAGTQPIADNATEDGRERNRRIVLRIIAPEGAASGDTPGAADDAMEPDRD
jgi:chemotaxis protein MotB